MKAQYLLVVVIVLSGLITGSCGRGKIDTIVKIRGNKFYINGIPTYSGKSWNGNKIDGLLFNSRMVQGIFDDSNPETRELWKYPDTKKWDTDRNTDEFVSSMQEWRSYGLLAFTLNLQGGSPTGYGNKDWRISAFNSDGSLKDTYFDRLERILDRSDDLGMVVILGLFYFAQDQYLDDEQAVLNAVDNTINWLLKAGYRNVIIEINNECNVDYDHDILKPERVHELISRVKNIKLDEYNYYAGTSYGEGTIPERNVVEVSDFILLHGNGISDPLELREMVRRTRVMPSYNAQPILINEDDHYDFDAEDFNLKAAVESYVSWGYFDYRREGETFEEGFQSVPADWSINSERKKAFFEKIKEITGG